MSATSSTRHRSDLQERDGAPANSRTLVWASLDPPALQQTGGSMLDITRIKSKTKSQ